MASSHWQSLWVNIHLATMTDGIQSYGVIEHAALAISDGKIVWLGEQHHLPEYDASQVTVIDGKGKWLTPGFIDCHTHLVYGGHRANEFEMRLQGKSYQEIANAGGGIISTVKATRKASEDQLLASALPRLKALHNEGVTTVEIKSGYGLTTEDEIKMLTVAGQLSEHLPVTIKRTFLGAHAIPPEYANEADSYINLVCEEMIPQVATKQLADSVDVFCESIGFDLKQTEQIFKAAKQHGLHCKVHAEQLTDMGGTELAAQYQALSADHVEYLTADGVEAMANANMTAVLLPGAFYFLRENQLPPIADFRAKGVAMALATDVNPGSSPLCSIQLMLNMACTLFKMTPVEALAGITCHGAKALGLAESKGMLKVGYDADFVLWDIEQPAQLCYQFGVNPLLRLVKAGKQVI